MTETRRFAFPTGLLLLFMAPAVLADPSNALFDSLQAGQSRLHEFLARHLSVASLERATVPARGRVDPAAPVPDQVAQLVVQQERLDGADLLTLRYPLLDRGGLRAYAGAGLSRHSEPDLRVDLPGAGARRERLAALGAAAELGAEYRVGERVLVSADLRYAGLDEDPATLDVDGTRIGTDAFAAGIAVGWRFR
jgi:hypothetical protein